MIDDFRATVTRPTRRERLAAWWKQEKTQIGWEFLYAFLLWMVGMIEGYALGRLVR